MIIIIIIILIIIIIIIIIIIMIKILPGVPSPPPERGIRKEGSYQRIS